MKFKVLPVSVATLLMSFNTYAQEMPRPQVGYTGVRTIQTGAGSYETTVYYEDSKERSEMNYSGQSMVSIMRHDMGMLWMLMPGGLYMEQPLDFSAPTMGPGQPPRAPTVAEGSVVSEFTEEGREAINGFDTTRYRMKAENADGSVVAGQIWLTEHNIPIQIRMLIESGAETGDVVISLQDLTIGDQPDDLFEIPSGYQKLNVANMSGFPTPESNGGVGPDDPSFTGELGEAAKEGAEEAAVQETKRGVRDAVSKGLRGIFNKN